MAPNPVTVVVSHGGNGNQPGLAVFPHNQAVDVIVRFRVSLKDAFRQHALQIFSSPGIHFGRVRIGALGQVNFGLGDMQKTPGAASSANPRLFAAEHIIGWRDNLCSPGIDWAQSGKWSYQGHVVSSMAGRKILPALYTVTPSVAIGAAGGH